MSTTRNLTVTLRAEEQADWFCDIVLYHQPEKMVRTKEDISERQENLERLKQQHGIE
jgi:hypothetical protein